MSGLTCWWKDIVVTVYYKTFFSWDKLIAMLFGIFSHCDSMGGSLWWDGGVIRQTKLFRNGLCTFQKYGRGCLRDRSEEVFRLYYFELIRYFRPVLSISRKEKVSFEKFYAFDSTLLSLFFWYNERHRQESKRRRGEERRVKSTHADWFIFVL